MHSMPMSEPCLRHSLGDETDALVEGEGVLVPRQRVERFGRTNYEIMLCDCLWHVYAMLGKLHRRAYALSRA